MKKTIILLVLILFLSTSSLFAQNSGTYFTEGNGMALTSFGIGKEYGRVNLEGNIYTPVFTYFIYTLFSSPEFAFGSLIITPFMYTSFEGKTSFDFIENPAHDLDLGLATDLGVSVGFSFITLSLEPFIRYTWNYSDESGVFLEASCPAILLGYSYNTAGQSLSVSTIADSDMVLSYSALKSKLGFIKRY